jgi:alkylhydroperoxidase/carboxymuconolactone decarboxylase family protein YurZ
MSDTKPVEGWPNAMSAIMIAKEIFSKRDASR